jgi:hypothetical protein
VGDASGLGKYQYWGVHAHNATPLLFDVDDAEC